MRMMHHIGPFRLRLKPSARHHHTQHTGGIRTEHEPLRLRVHGPRPVPLQAGERLALGVSGAVLDVGPNHEPHGRIVRQGRIALAGRSREREGHRVASPYHREGDIERDGLTAADRNVKAPCHLARRRLTERTQTGAAQLLGVGLVDHPYTATRQHHVAVNRVVGMEVGGQEGIVLTLDLSPGRTHLRHRAASIRTEGIAALRQRLNAGHLGRRVRNARRQQQ